YKNKGRVAKTFDWDEEEVSDDEEMTQVKVLMTLVDDELAVGKNHARNDLKYVEAQRLNLLSKYNKLVFELNKCRDDLLVFKQAKLEAVTFQLQITKFIKQNHALQEQLKEEKRVNEKWLNSSNKVSQCINEQIPNQKKKILGIDQLIEALPKNDVKENPFIPASMDYDHEMIPKSKYWVIRHNPDSEL
ncbi:hypothetical protein Tco_0119445, partial [Tanacetum coccineum]